MIGVIEEETRSISQKQILEEKNNKKFTMKSKDLKNILLHQDMDHWLQQRSVKFRSNSVTKPIAIETRQNKLGISISFEQAGSHQSPTPYNKIKSGFSMTRKHDYPNTLNLLSSNIIGQLFSDKKRKTTPQVVNIIRSNIKQKKKDDQEILIKDI